jgi:hypothetical protein
LRPSLLPIRLHYLTPAFARVQDVSALEPEQVPFGKALHFFHDKPLLRGGLFQDALADRDL